ncbi:glycosyltransferase involved in cell wall biosynthesis [Catenuloplanes nepalensis]|uniref:4,4'-diaponeurosporenoate glycosyltransferase n=1 Tax=Catenuloplanes nepalensis TaxID=587533 RepID=A0ABT9N0Z5_9ACTN|nr:glycosyltransferase family 2 protein [Catenuloplanes nepalensis]MDP9797365.1 glycosyltransferase involved in cell wall biosynthesis [Catenuloplanes nepalensis]
MVVPAHNEAAMLDRCLDRVAGPGVQVIVVPNGCTDDTAAIARGRGDVQVVELAEGSKTAALNAGDRLASGFPRLYVDGDVTLSPGSVHRLAEALRRTGALVAIPRRELDLTGRPLAVRAYFAIHNRLPAVRTGLFGRGVIALSATGRSRFDEFPAVMADDLFLDSLFGAHERVVVDEAASEVATPRRTADLLRRLRRVRSGNAALRAASAGTRKADPWSWLRDVVLRKPWLAPAGVIYFSLTVLAALQARRTPSTTWERDESSRAGAA